MFQTEAHINYAYTCPHCGTYCYIEFSYESLSDDTVTLSCPVCYNKFRLKKPEVWVCGQVRAETEEGPVWDLQGIFVNKDSAKKSCIKENYFIGKTEIEKLVPEEQIHFKESKFPLLED